MLYVPCNSKQGQISSPFSAKEGKEQFLAKKNKKSQRGGFKGQLQGLFLFSFLPLTKWEPIDRDWDKCMTVSEQCSLFAKLSLQWN